MRKKIKCRKKEQFINDDKEKNAKIKKVNKSKGKRGKS